MNICFLVPQASLVQRDSVVYFVNMFCRSGKYYKIGNFYSSSLNRVLHVFYVCTKKLILKLSTLFKWIKYIKIDLKYSAQIHAQKQHTPFKDETHKIVFLFPFIYIYIHTYTFMYISSYFVSYIIL